MALASLGRLTIVAEIATAEFNLDPNDCELADYKSDGSNSAYLWNIESILEGSDAVLDEVSDVRKYASSLLAQVRNRNRAN